MFPNARSEGGDFSNTSSVNCGLQRKDSSEKVVRRVFKHNQWGR